MKRCPECRRDYYDDSLMYCLDDGQELLHGPVSSDEAATRILSDMPSSEHGKPEATGQGRTRKRWQTWIFPGIVGVVLVALGVVGVYRYYFGQSRQASISSIAVLPLENLSGDPAQEYFADGLTETLIGNLSQIRSISVTARRSVMRFKGSNESISEIAKQLGVDAVIEGTVQRADGRIKITTQLIPATTNAPIWSRTYESDLTDVLKLQSDVAQAIVGELHAKLTPSEQNRLRSAKTVDPKAHDAYLQGSYHLGKLNKMDLALAVEYFEQAIQADPAFAEAYAGLSRAWSFRGIWGGVTRIEADKQARTAAEKALELDPENSSAHVAMASILMNSDYDWTNAEKEAKRAIELDPGNADGYVTYAWILQCLGRHAEVVPNMEMAKRIDPVSTQIESDYGRMLYRARNYLDAETHLKRSMELDPNNFTAYGRLADVYLELGRYDDAIMYNNKAEGIRADGTYKLRLATVYARMGKREEALLLLRQSDKASAPEAARVYATLDDLDRAFAILNAAADGKNALLSNLKEEPGLDQLHKDPRWKLILRRLNFPDT